MGDVYIIIVPDLTYGSASGQLKAGHIKSRMHSMSCKGLEVPCEVLPIVPQMG